MGERLLYPPDDQTITFLRGANSLNPPHALPLHAHQIMENVVLDEQGAATKRWGYTRTTAVGIDYYRSLYAELVRNDGTTHRLSITGSGGGTMSLSSSENGALKVYTAVPFKLTTTDTGSGAVGANLVGATKYQYAMAAVMSSKRSPYNLLVDAATTGEITTGATPYPLQVVAYGVYGATTYEVWRRTYSGSWGSWGRLTTAPTHTSANGITTVTYTDDGNTAPDTGIPTTDLIGYRSTSAVFTWAAYAAGGPFDWVVVRKDGNNVLLFTNGAGLFWTDGSAGYSVQPSTTTLGGATLTENRLWDVTDEVWTGKGLHVHHRYVWISDMTNFPQTFLYSDLDDFGYFPQNGYINVPDPRGGRILDFATKDEVLVIGMNTGVWGLWGKEFATSGPNQLDNYFTKLVDVGVASEWSMAIAPNGWLVYHGNDKQPHFLANVTSQLRSSEETRLCEQILPTLQGYSDHDDAFGCVDGNTYYLMFPTDGKTLKVRFFQGPEGTIVAPTIDTFGFDQIWRFADGKYYAVVYNVSGLSTTAFEIYKSSVYTDAASTAVTMKIRTAAYGCGFDSYIKRFRKNHTTYKVGSTAYTMTVQPYVDNQTLTSDTLSSPADSSYQTPKTSELDCKGKGRFIIFEYTHSGTTTRPTLYGFRIEHVPKRRPRGDD